MRTDTSEKYLRECLNQARYYEFCTEAERALTVLSPIWKSLDESPDIEGLDPRLACEILLVCGAVISYHGQSQQNSSYQETASDLLTRAREIADEISDRELIAETEKQIGLSYFRRADYENAIAYFKTSLERYSPSEQLTENICLQIQTNLLMTYASNEESIAAYDLLQKLHPEVEISENTWLKNSFYNQAAGVHLKAGNFRKAIPFLEKAVEYSQLNRNMAFCGISLNNLALVYLKLDEPDTAMKYVVQAIDTYSRLNHLYTLGMALDTKAQIEIAKGQLKNALHTIDESIAIFEKGENYPYLAESLWTRTRILIESGDKFQAIRQFTRLMQVVEKHLNRIAVEFYTQSFESLVYLPSGANFYEQAENYRIYLLDKALKESGGVVNPTAAKLGISHQSTSKILKKLPDLCEKHNVKLKNRSTDSLTKSNRRKKKIEPAEVLVLKTDRLKHIGLPKDTTVRFERCALHELELSKPVVILDEERKYHCGFLIYDFEMYAFEDGLGNIELTFIQSEILDCGQVVSVFDAEDKVFIPLEDLE